MDERQFEREWRSKVGDQLARLDRDFQALNLKFELLSQRREMDAAAIADISKKVTSTQEIIAGAQGVKLTLIVLGSIAGAAITALIGYLGLHRG